MFWKIYGPYGGFPQGQDGEIVQVYDNQGDDKKYLGPLCLIPEKRLNFLDSVCP